MTNSFARFPTADLNRLDGAKIAILGVAEASPYKLGVASHSANAPGALRRASESFAGQLEQFDFDLGWSLMADGELGVVDCGDLPVTSFEPKANRERILAAVRTILSRGSAPVVLGGDDSVPIPFFQAFEGRGPFTVIQIDAHADWGDIIQGNPNGYGSPMRRASELPWITNIIQFGLRGLGSGGEWQIRDAEAWGARLIRSRELHAAGLARALEYIPEGTEALVTIDCDGIDPAILPAVNMPTPGGLSYEDVMGILHGVASRVRIAGFVLTELVPERDDPHKLSALTAARIVSVALGLIGRAKRRSDPNGVIG